MDPIRSVMVYLDGTPRCEARLTLAHDIARTHDAHLTALFAATPPMPPTPYAYGASGAVAEALMVHDGPLDLGQVQSHPRVLQPVLYRRSTCVILRWINESWCARAAEGRSAYGASGQAGASRQSRER